MDLFYALVKTPMGWMGLLGSKKGLRRTTLPQPSPEAALDSLGKVMPGAELVEAAFFGDLPQRLQRYFQGQAVEFSAKLDWEGATPFQKAVWQETKAIPLGETRTYGWLAAQVGRPGAARAVGRAMATNPIPLIVPCHRVVGSQGQLTGFGGGLAMKRALLELEAKASRRGN